MDFFHLLEITNMRCGVVWGFEVILRGLRSNHCSLQTPLCNQHKTTHSQTTFTDRSLSFSINIFIFELTLALGTSSSYILPSFNVLVKSGGVTVSINLAMRGNGKGVVPGCCDMALLVVVDSIAEEGLASLSSFPELMPEELKEERFEFMAPAPAPIPVVDDVAAARRAARAAALLASLTLAFRAATGSTLEVVGPLISWMEMEAPGGRCRAYLARRASMPLLVGSGTAMLLLVALVAAAAATAAAPEDDDGDGGGRLREVFAMVKVRR